MSTWNDVEELLPEHENEYLVDISIASYHAGYALAVFRDGDWHLDTALCDYEHISAWMEIPCSPSLLRSMRDMEM